MNCEETVVIGGVEYAAEKPRDCRYCYFWKDCKTGCILGPENCYYIVKAPEREPSPCDGCPYGRDRPCIGWCTKKILGQLEVIPGD